MAAKAPLRVLVTGAAGQIAYSLIPLIASGKTFGEDQPIILHLLDIEPMKTVLNGVVMEIEDALFPALHSVVATTNTEDAFRGVQVAVLLGGFPRKAGMTRADLLSKNAPIFVAQGKALNTLADKNVKVLVVANPANTNCLIAASNAPDLPRSAFSALTRLDANRARAQVANKLGVNLKYINNVLIWGNHSKSMVPDLSHGTLTTADGKQTPLPAAIGDEKWISDVFVPTVQNRGTAVIEARGLSSALSAAQAVSDHTRDWILGTKPGQWTSMAVWSDGSYGAPKDVIFSFPVTCAKGEFQLVRDVPLSDAQKKLLKITGDELVAEKGEAGL